MGCWSVYCGISNITIDDGQDCVILPLLKYKYTDINYPYLPPILPIFGNYDSYGSLDNIINDENTELIQNYFNCTIQEFVNFLCKSGNRSKHDSKIFENNKEALELEYMWIDRKVYDFLISNIHTGYGGRGDFNLGKSKLLTYLGFTFEEENLIGERVWSYEGKRFTISKYGDSLHNVDGTSISDIYSINDKGLEDYINLPEYKKEIGKKARWQIWQYLDDIEMCDALLFIMGCDRYAWLSNDSNKRFREIAPNIERVTKQLTRYKITEKYFDNLEIFGDKIADLVSIYHNLYSMSGYFKPYKFYITPQCGEYTRHQIILDEFSKINKQIAIQHGFDCE